MNEPAAEELPVPYDAVHDVEDGLPTEPGDSEQAELLHADMPRIRQALANDAESIRARFAKLQSGGYFDVRQEHTDTADARRTVEGNFNEFLSTYFPDGELDHQAIAGLAEMMMSKIEVVPISELMDTARKLVEESRGDTIYLWVGSDKLRGADWKSSYSSSSNEFMAKMVERYATLAHKNVELMSETDEIAGHEHELYMIDDVAYTGSQIGDNLLSLSLYVNDRPTNVKLYVARASDNALRAIYAEAQIVRSITVTPVRGRPIQNLSGILEHHSPAWQYFWTEQLADELVGVLRDLHEVLGSTWRYFGRETLTMLPSKVPDAVSFPYAIAQGLPRVEGRAKYPSLDDLHFVLDSESTS